MNSAPGAARPLGSSNSPTITALSDVGPKRSGALPLLNTMRQVVGSFVLSTLGEGLWHREPQTGEVETLVSASPALGGAAQQAGFAQVGQLPSPLGRSDPHRRRRGPDCPRSLEAPEGG